MAHFAGSSAARIIQILLRMCGAICTPHLQSWTPMLTSNSYASKSEVAGTKCIHVTSISPHGDTEHFGPSITVLAYTWLQRRSKLRPLRRSMAPLVTLQSCCRAVASTCHNALVCYL